MFPDRVSLKKTDLLKKPDADAFKKAYKMMLKKPETPTVDLGISALIALTDTKTLVHGPQAQSTPTLE